VSGFFCHILQTFLLITPSLISRRYAPWTLDIVGLFFGLVGYAKFSLVLQ